MYYEFKSAREYLLFLRETCEIEINPENLLTTHQQYLGQFKLGDPADEPMDIGDLDFKSAHIFSIEGLVGYGPDIGDPEVLFTIPGMKGAFRRKVISRYNKATWYPDAEIPELQRFKPTMDPIGLPRGMIYTGPCITDERRQYATVRPYAPVVISKSIEGEHNG